MALLLLPLAGATSLSNDNYHLDVGIGVAGQVENTNYKIDVVMITPQAEVNNDNYKMVIGYLTDWITSTTPAEEESTTTDDRSAAKLYLKYLYASNGATLFAKEYVIKIDNLHSTYEAGSTLTPHITILNKKKNPEYNGTLVYYITDKEGNSIVSNLKKIGVLPVACPNATYRRDKQQCFNNGTWSEPESITLNGTLVMPPEYEKGDWEYHVRYETNSPKIEAYKTFRLGFGTSFAVIVLLVAVLAIIWERHRQRKKTEKKAKEV